MQESLPATQTQDTLPADTTVVDSVASTPSDSVDAIGSISRGITEAGELLATGQFSEFWNKVLSSITESTAGFAPNLIGALFVFLLFYIAYRAFGSVLRRFLRRSKRVDLGLESLLMKTYRIVATVFIAIMVLAQFGVNVTALLAGLSIAGIAVGFAAKDTLENFISGVTILLDKPFAIGDVIQVEGTYGVVEDLTLRSTRVKTLNNQIMVLPNVHMVNQKVINFTMLGVVRVDIEFGIAYKEFPQQAREVVLPLTEGDDDLHPEFAPEVVVTKLNDSSIDMQLRVFLKDARKETRVRMRYIEKIREALREADIEIPFPHLQLFIDEAKAFEEMPLMQPPSRRPPPAEA